MAYIERNGIMDRGLDKESTHITPGQFGEIAHRTHHEGSEQKNGAIISALEAVRNLMSSLPDKERETAGRFLDYAVRQVRALGEEEEKMIKAAEFTMEGRDVPLIDKPLGPVFDLDQIH